MSNQLEDDLRRVLQLARAEGRAHKNKEAKQINSDKLHRHRHDRFLTPSKEGRHTLLTATLQGLAAVDGLDSHRRPIRDCSHQSVLSHCNNELSEEDDDVLHQRLDARRTLYKRHFAGALATSSGQTREVEHVLEAAARAARSSRPTGLGIGAAVLTDSQTLYSASAIENGALMLCAERAVVTKMVTSHASSVIIAMAICSEQRALLPFPCGGCRELLADCGDFPVYLVNAIGETEATTSSALFPRARHSELTQLFTQSHQFKQVPPPSPAVSTLTDPIPCKVQDWTPQDVLKWLDADVDLSQYSQVFERNHIDGCTLVLLEGSDLQLLLGITHPLHRSKLLTFIDRLRDRELLARGLDYAQLEDYLAVLDIDRVSAVAQLKSTFDRLDANHDGFLDFPQVKHALSRLRCTLPSLSSKKARSEASAQAVERLFHSEELFGKEAATTGNVSFPAFARAFAKLATQAAETSIVTQGALAVHALGPRLAVLDLQHIRQCFDHQAHDDTLDEANLVRVLRDLGQSDAQSSDLACRWLDAQETTEETSDRMTFAQFITRYAQVIDATGDAEVSSVVRLQQLFRSFEPVHSSVLKPRSVVPRALATLFPALSSDEVTVWCAAHWPSKVSTTDSRGRQVVSTTLSFPEFTLACLEFAAESSARDQEAALIKQSIRNDALVHRSRVVHLHSSGHVRMCPQSKEQEKDKQDTKSKSAEAKAKESQRRDDDDDGKCAEREGKEQDSEKDEDTSKRRSRREQHVDEAFDRFTRRHRSKSRMIKDDVKEDGEEEDESCRLNAVEAAQAALELGTALSREQVLRYLEREGLGQIRRRDISRAAFHRLMKRLDANQTYPRDLLLGVDNTLRQQSKTFAFSPTQVKTTRKSPRIRAYQSRPDYDEFLRQKRAQSNGTEWVKQVDALRQKHQNHPERQGAKMSKKERKTHHKVDSEDDGKHDSDKGFTENSDFDGRNSSTRSQHRCRHRAAHHLKRIRKRQSRRSHHLPQHHSSSSSEASTETKTSSSTSNFRSYPFRNSRFRGFESGTRVASMVHGRGTIERLYFDYFVADVHFDSGRHLRNVELSTLRVLDPEDEAQIELKWNVGTRVRIAHKGTKTQRLGKIILCRTDGTFDILVNEFGCPRTFKRMARNALTLVDKKPLAYRSGARVMVRQRTEYLRGKVCTCRKDGTYDVKLYKSPQRVLQCLASELLTPDNDEDGLSDDEVAQVRAQDWKEEMKVTFSRGDRVEARFGGQTSYYPGTIERTHPNGMYDISYDDGDEEERVSLNLIRALPKKPNASKQTLKKALDTEYESDLFDSD